MSQALLELLDDAESGEGIEHWNIGLYEGPDMTVKRNVGVQNVWIVKYIIAVNDTNKELFAVEVETNAEIVNWRDGEAKVLAELVESPTYELGEFEVVEAFETYMSAFDYAMKHYPEEDLVALIKTHFDTEQLKF